MTDQKAEKLYNIEEIGTAHFGDNYYGDKKIPKILSTSLPFIPDFFLGRSDDLQVVHDKLFSGENLLLLVNGEGGIGKTTFAAKYWQCYENQYHHLAWIFAGNNLLNSLLTLALKLQLSFPDTMPADQRLSEMLAVMAGLEKPCLLVLDNANDADDLGNYYQALHTCANCHVLLTTRITTFEQAEMYPIPPLGEADALRLFKKHYTGHRDKDEELFKAIYIAVGGNTLALELLAKNLTAINMDEVFYPLADLLRDLQQKGLFQLSQEEKIKLSGKHCGLGFVETKPTDVLKALYDEVEMVKPLNEAEKRLLSNLAVLPSENIPYEQLKILLAPEDAKAFSNSLTDLAKRGWIEKSKQETGDTQYKISPVIQEITLHKNQSQLLEHIGILLNTLNQKLAYEPGIGHFLNASYEEAATYTKYAEAVAGKLSNADEDLAILCERIGSYHQTTGNLDQALRFFEKDIELSKELYDAYPQNVSFKNGLAISYYQLGRFYRDYQDDRVEAKQNFEQCYKLWEGLSEAYPAYVEFKNNFMWAKNALDNLC